MPTNQPTNQLTNLSNVRGGDEPCSSLPKRTCIGCKAKLPQDQLVRVTVDPSGLFQVGRELPGRGAWLCGAPKVVDGGPNPECLDLAAQRGGFQRAFRLRLTAAEIENRFGPGFRRPTIESND